MWYLLTINPFLDYAFPHPSGQKILMLDWAEAEDVLFDIVERGKARPYLPWEAAQAAEPGPKAGDCLTKAQQKMVANFLAQPGVSKIVGIHAPPIAPWFDWFDSELVESKKIFPRFSTITSREDCEKIGEKWEEDDKRCVAKRVPRGPDLVNKLGTGEEQHWHPFFAIRPTPRAFDGMVADYGSLVEKRDWFITQLIEPKNGVRAVFAGHNHRDGLHILWRMGPESGPETDGALRVRLVAGRLRSVKPGSILGPLWVNTTTAGFRGHYWPRPGQYHYVPPGRALVSVQSDGTIDVAEFRRLPGIDKRVAVPTAASTPGAPVMASEASAGTEDSLEEEILVNSRSADGFLDRAERSLPGSDGDRRESETVFLQRLLGELGCRVSAPRLSPAELSGAFLYDRPLKHNARDVLEVLAMPSQRPEGALRQGTGCSVPYREPGM
jgi:hypothetical protein